MWEKTTEENSQLVMSRVARVRDRDPTRWEVDLVTWEMDLSIYHRKFLIRLEMIIMSKSNPFKDQLDIKKKLKFHLCPEAQKSKNPLTTIQCVVKTSWVRIKTTISWTNMSTTTYILTLSSLWKASIRMCWSFPRTCLCQVLDNTATVLLTEEMWNLFNSQKLAWRCK